MKHKRNDGFTLIEVLIVVLIIGVLAATIVPKLTGRAEKARVASAQSDVKGALALALDLYEADNGNYPDNLSSLIPNYLKDSTIPNDPWGSAYQYTRTTDGYTLSSNGPDGIQGTSDDITG